MLVLKVCLLHDKYCVCVALTNHLPNISQEPTCSRCYVEKWKQRGGCVLSNLSLQRGEASKRAPVAIARQQWFISLPQITSAPAAQGSWVCPGPSGKVLQVSQRRRHGALKRGMEFDRRVSRRKHFRHGGTRMQRPIWELWQVQGWCTGVIRQEPVTLGSWVRVNLWVPDATI